jgi:ABC-type oligopeptide transport system substrate-binding subunit
MALFRVKLPGERLRAQRLRGWVRQPDLESLKQNHPHLRYQDFLLNAVETISMRTDKPPFNDVRVRRAISKRWALGRS